eukprot:COSAG04_NODE_968_length_9110_cov_6.799911_9_plen_65_part_00
MQTNLRRHKREACAVLLRVSVSCAVLRSLAPANGDFEFFFSQAQVFVSLSYTVQKSVFWGEGPR